jgi:uncharacterized membrane protein
MGKTRNRTARSNMIFNPFTFFFTIVFFAILLFFFFVVQINLIALAFAEIGIPSQYVFTALFVTLFGSFVNIPVKRIPQEEMVEARVVRFFGMRHIIPVWKRKETLLAVNFGGAVIPTLLSAYLLLKTGLWWKAAIATAAMAFLTHRLAKPIEGVGIALPPLVPPAAAALLSLLIADSNAPVVAYVSGTVGTLVGADLLNLKKIANLGAPVASIGGAGTFDGIFLNGILAVALSALFA